MLQTVYSRRPGSESGRAGATRGITLKFQYCSMSPLLIQDCTALSGLAVVAAPGINNRKGNNRKGIRGPQRGLRGVSFQKEPVVRSSGHCLAAVLPYNLLCED
jgi:hypothetical protein